MRVAAKAFHFEIAKPGVDRIARLAGPRLPCLAMPNLARPCGTQPSHADPEGLSTLPRVRPSYQVTSNATVHPATASAPATACGA